LPATLCPAAPLAPAVAVWPARHRHRGRQCYGSTPARAARSGRGLWVSPWNYRQPCGNIDPLGITGTRHRRSDPGDCPRRWSMMAGPIIAFALAEGWNAAARWPVDIATAPRAGQRRHPRLNQRAPRPDGRHVPLAGITAIAGLSRPDRRHSPERSARCRQLEHGAGEGGSGLAGSRATPSLFVATAIRSTLRPAGEAVLRLAPICVVMTVRRAISRRPTGARSTIACRSRRHQPAAARCGGWRSAALFLALVARPTCSIGTGSAASAAARFETGSDPRDLGRRQPIAPVTGLWPSQGQGAHCPAASRGAG
jgi:hypothetical protein